MKKFTKELKIEAMERLRKGQEPEHIAAVMEVQLREVEQVNLTYWKSKLQESQRAVNLLKDQLKGKEELRSQNSELRETIRKLNAQIDSMKPAIDSVNRLSAERSKLIRKLKKAGVKI